MISQLYKKRLFHLFYVCIALGGILFNSCDDDDDDDLIGNWVKESSCDGVGRSEAVVFTIGTKAYVGTGYNGEIKEYLKDFWVYNSETGGWDTIESLPGGARINAVAFSIGNKGYVGCGYDGVSNRLKDFYCYDPSTNKWTTIADFGGAARDGAVAFAIKDKGYVGCGYNGNYLKDFWQYDPATDTWTKKVFNGEKRRNAVAFVIDDCGYIASGINNGTYEDDFWKYDPNTDTWTELNSISNATEKSFDDEYTSIVGYSKSVFVIGSCAYLVGGSGSIGGTTWEFNSVTDSWELKTSFEQTARTEALGFTINDVGYYGFGRSSSFYYDDIFSFEPNEEYNEYD